MIDIDKVYNADCLEGMKAIDDGVVDFVLTDLPFGITAAPFDVKIDLAKFWEQINRVTKRTAAIALFANSKFLIELGASNIKNYRYKWIWQKNSTTGFLNAKKMPLKAHEDILIFYRQLPTYNPQFTQGKPKNWNSDKQINSRCYNAIRNRRTGYHNLEGKYYPKDIVVFNTMLSGGAKYDNGLHCIHPTEKPVDLLEYLIKTYTNEGELVLDATIGSGSTAVAAVNTGRHFIGFETEKKFCDIANERISKVQAEKAQALF